MRQEPLTSHQFDINVRGVIFISQAAANFMGDGGRIINLSSASARAGLKGQTVYASSKAAVEAVTHVMGVGSPTLYHPLLYNS